MSSSLRPAQFEDLFAKYYQPLVAYVTRLVIRSDVAEDVVVDVFVSLHSVPDRWVPEDEARRFLYRAVHNKALDVIRIDANRDRLLQEHGSADTIVALGEPESDPLEKMVEVEALQALNEALEQLPPQRRAAVTLRLEHGMRNMEIAEVMQISVKTVELHISLGTKELRSQLARFRED